MTTARGSDENWKIDARPQLVIDIHAAIAQLKADEEYEKGSFKVSETIGLLREISSGATLLAQQLSSLSPVALSAINEGSRGQSRKLELNGKPFMPKAIFRAEIRGAVSIGLNLADACKRAIDIIKVGHFSDLESGQGTGSSQGKESDLRAIGYADGFETVPFKSPKDKFGVRVLEALARNEHPLMGPNSKPRHLTTFLNLVWADAEQSIAVNWTRVLRVRFQIAEKARSEEKRRSAVRLKMSKQNAAWLKKQKLHSTGQS
ncbi:hypothetical protein [Sphingomonas baiyangensis]|uniref:Uncharacterized protein n=1 Tax=Sphingomonas baiyangensis TaxID=2572576 RepID=A0A4V5PTI0_9SPHN|nr:hypothetical protein [Sphingomonas baiyangensis]TKD50158.1 hypothetical protein FBR43_04850 [Sphingomonas baiyangensis]